MVIPDFLLPRATAPRIEPAGGLPEMFLLILRLGLPVGVRAALESSGRASSVCHGASSRNRTGTLPCGQAADFKSAVSTYFTIRASGRMLTIPQTKKVPSISIGGTFISAWGSMEARSGVEPD